MSANSLAQCWAQSSTHAVGILSVIFRGYSNLQTVNSGLETFKEVQIDATGPQLTLARGGAWRPWLFGLQGPPHGAAPGPASQQDPSGLT